MVSVGRMHLGFDAPLSARGPQPVGMGILNSHMCTWGIINLISMSEQICYGR